LHFSFPPNPAAFWSHPAPWLERLLLARRLFEPFLRLTRAGAMTFADALKEALAGKSIRRACWPTWRTIVIGKSDNGFTCLLRDTADGTRSVWHIPHQALLVNDWEVAWHCMMPVTNG
jgi:hypothetical protein